MNVLQIKSGGPLVREWVIYFFPATKILCYIYRYSNANNTHAYDLQQQKLLTWQLAHATGTSEECLEWMRQTHSKRVKTE